MLEHKQNEHNIVPNALLLYIHYEACSSLEKKSKINNNNVVVSVSPSGLLALEDSGHFFKHKYNNKHTYTDFFAGIKVKLEPLQSSYFELVYL